MIHRNVHLYYTVTKLNPLRTDLFRELILVAERLIMKQLKEEKDR